MFYPEPMDRAKNLGEQAFALMQRHNVAPNPNNYTLLYLYTRGRNPDLCRAIDIMVENGVELSPQRLDELYVKFVFLQQDDVELARTSLEMADVIHRMIESFAEAGDNTINYGKQLRNFSGDIDQVSSGDDLRQLISRMIIETRLMEEHNQELQDKLNHSSDTISEMGKRLEDVKKEALTDGLTNIANRKCFDMRLDEAVAEAKQSQQPLSLAMVDIDHFKKFNDTYGHQMGDQVLRLIGDILKKSVKGQDTPARYGGEEFSIILPNTALGDAATLAEKIRCTVANRRVTKKSTGEELCQITLSIGISQYRPGEPASELVLRADDALYSAKRDGRNRVISDDMFAEMPVAG